MLEISNVAGTNMIACLCHVCVIESATASMTPMKSGAVSKSSLLLLMMLNLILKDKVINSINNILKFIKKKKSEYIVICTAIIFLIVKTNDAVGST